MNANNPQTESTSESSLVTVSDWTACYNSEDDEIALYCTVTTNDSSDTITGVGVLLNNSAGATLASCYTELTGGSSSVTPSLNLPPGGLSVGDTVRGVVTGEVQGEHFFTEQELTITHCE